LTASSPGKIRADLARGHLMLGELEQAYSCLERVVLDEPQLPELAGLLEELVAAAGGSPLEGAVRELAVRAATGILDAEGPTTERFSTSGIEAATPTTMPDPVSPSLSGDQLARHARAARLEAWLELVRRRYARAPRAHGGEVA